MTKSLREFAELVARLHSAYAAPCNDLFISQAEKPYFLSLAKTPRRINFHPYCLSSLFCHSLRLCEKSTFFLSPRHQGYRSLSSPASTCLPLLSVPACQKTTCLRPKDRQTGLCGSVRDSSLEYSSGLPCLECEEP